ncbi:MAG: hypothetical protein MJ188_03650 [Treponema sp.]|nr:hypothetical protein [Treponema sp.]
MKKVLIAIFALCMLGLSSCEFKENNTHVVLINDRSDWFIEWVYLEDTTFHNYKKHGVKGKGLLSSGIAEGESYTISPGNQRGKTLIFVDSKLGAPYYYGTYIDIIEDETIEVKASQLNLFIDDSIEENKW